MAKKDTKKKKDVEAVDIADMKPIVYLSKKDLPAIQKWDVGNKYKLVMEVEMTSKNESQHRDGEERLTANFEVLSVTSDSKDDFEKGLESDGYEHEDKQPKR